MCPLTLWSAIDLNVEEDLQHTKDETALGALAVWDSRTEVCRSSSWVRPTLWVTTAFFFCLLAASTLTAKHSSSATATVAVFQPAILLSVIAVPEQTAKGEDNHSSSLSTHSRGTAST